MDKTTLLDIRRLAAAGAWRMALKQVDAVLAHDAGDAGAWCERGTLLLLHDPQRATEAMQAFDTSIKLDAGNPMSLYNRACLHAHNKDFSAAARDVAAAIALDRDCLAMAREDESFDVARTVPQFEAVLLEQ